MKYIYIFCNFSTLRWFTYMEHVRPLIDWNLAHMRLGKIYIYKKQSPEYYYGKFRKMCWINSKFLINLAVFIDEFLAIPWSIMNIFLVCIWVVIMCFCASGLSQKDTCICKINQVSFSFKLIELTEWILCQWKYRDFWMLWFSRCCMHSLILL